MGMSGALRLCSSIGLLDLSRRPGEAGSTSKSGAAADLIQARSLSHAN